MQPLSDIDAELAAIHVAEMEKAKRKLSNVGTFLRNKAWPVAKKLVLCIVVLLLGIASYEPALFLYEGYEAGGIKKKYVVDTRPCNIPIPGTDSSLRGQREYGYTYYEFNGWRWYSANTVEEKTRINTVGDPMTIIGISEGESSEASWLKNIDMGERYSQLLENKDRYTFVIGDKRYIAVVDYEAMCK